MPITRNPRRWFAGAFALSILLAVGGCAQPSEDARQNRRLTDSLLTAVTTKNVKELDKCMGLIDKRKTDGLLAEAMHKQLSDIFSQAKAGQWTEAEDALYKFRESIPFPK